MQLSYNPGMDEQLSLRLPAELARALRRAARERGVARSLLVREALQAYFAAGAPPDPEAAWQRFAVLAGSVRLTPAGAERDALARRIRDHNWRG